MNPHNQPYNYSQSTPGPPQPPWQAPPRKSGWADPRLRPQSPASPQNAGFHDFGPPLPPPPPPPAAGQQPPAQYSTAAWGVRYNQTIAPQSHESKPPLPPRPPSAAGRISPQPDYAYAPNYHQQPPPHVGASQQYPPPWSDPYQSRPSPQSSTFPAPTPAPPPPPPRPAAYEAEVQSYYNQANTAFHEYSQKPPTHHYDPQPQNAWNAQVVPAGGPAYYPSAPAPHQVTATHDAPLVSPIEPSNMPWGQQGEADTFPTANKYQRPQDNVTHSQVLGFGRPSDWELWQPGVAPEQTPTSPHNPPPDTLAQAHGSAAPPPAHASPSTSQTPNPPPVHAQSPVEIGAASPVTARRVSHQDLPKFQAEPSQSQSSQSPPSAGRRDGSMSVRSDSINSAGKIDSVIQAWSTPLRVRASHEPSSRPDSRTSTRVDSPEPVQNVKYADPYADLEPEFKASLKRYAAMLRKEISAESDEEKFEIFQSFVTKELRLRSLLYGVELNKAAKDVKKAASLADMQAALPKSVQEATEDAKSDTANHPTTSISARAVSKQPITTESGIQPRVVSAPEQPPSSKAGFLAGIGAAPEQDEAYSPGGRPRAAKTTAMPSIAGSISGMADNSASNRRSMEDDEAYSPGGRPKVLKPPVKEPDRPFPSLNTFPQNRSYERLPVGALSPSNDAPMVIEDYAMAQPPSPGMNAPMIVEPEQPRSSWTRSSEGQKPAVPIKFEPARPAYTPFRYSAATREEQTQPLQPADEAYSSLRHSMADSGRLMARETLLTTPRPSSTTGRKEHEEAFIGLIRKQSMAVRQKSAEPRGAARPGDNAIRADTPAFMRVGTPASVRAEDPSKETVKALRSLLPKKTFEESVQHPSVADLKTKIDSVPNQFEFIHETVVHWDRTNREVRKQQDTERRTRQEESEAHLDALFNDNEIGYADIGNLEAEFKLAEAEQKYRENQEELESFAGQVFTPVTERLRKEIRDLSKAYATATELLDRESEPVSRCFKGQTARARMSEVMGCVITLFNKIEIRHRKLAEAHMERERRRKHLELTVLYMNNDKAGMTKLEQDFAAAEKTQVLHEARAKDERANKLMDTFDRATVRGLGDNQMFIDDILVKIQDLKKMISSGEEAVKATLYEAEGPRDTLASTQDVVGLVMADSRKMLALSNEADVLLNDSDYGVSVAEAQVANADKVTYTSLEKEKAKEDVKLVEEMNVRIASVTKGPQDAIDAIREMMDQIGDDPEHQDRIKKALQAAKQRNASNDQAHA
ncbi:hypothetical protein LTS15_009236 [Exophiala xenobiotica]|nr:hypothetical protein LTS15_009236 [Exophiala xenobiotica]